MTMFHTVVPPNSKEYPWNSCRDQCAGCGPDDSEFSNAQSNHPGGVNTLFGDGSVKFMRTRLTHASGWRLGRKPVMRFCPGTVLTPGTRSMRLRTEGAIQAEDVVPGHGGCVAGRERMRRRRGCQRRPRGREEKAAQEAERDAREKAYGAKPNNPGKTKTKR